MLDSYITMLSLIAARFAPLLMVPAFSAFSWIPVQVRAVVLAALSLLALGVTDAGRIAPLTSPLALGVALAGESMVGMSLSLAIVLPMAALGFAARVVDLQSGIGAASLFNPAHHAADSLVSTILQWAGLLVFFASGMHVALVKGLLASLELVPLGAGAALVSPSRFMELLSTQFLLGLMIVLPVILGLFAIDLGTAYASRSMPQANIYFVALPLKLLAALFLLAASLRLAPGFIEHLYRGAFAGIPGMVGA